MRVYSLVSIIALLASLFSTSSYALTVQDVRSYTLARNLTIDRKPVVSAGGACYKPSDATSVFYYCFDAVEHRAFKDTAQSRTTKIACQNSMSFGDMVQQCLVMDADLIHRRQEAVVASRASVQANATCKVTFDGPINAELARKLEHAQMFIEDNDIVEARKIIRGAAYETPAEKRAVEAAHACVNKLTDIQYDRCMGNVDRRSSKSWGVAIDCRNKLGL